MSHGGRECDGGGIIDGDDGTDEDNERCSLATTSSSDCSAFKSSRIRFLTRTCTSPIRGKHSSIVMVSMSCLAVMIYGCVKSRETIRGSGGRGWLFMSRSLHSMNF